MIRLLSVFLLFSSIIQAIPVSGQTVTTVTRSPVKANTIPFSGSSFPFINTANLFSGNEEFASATALLRLKQAMNYCGLSRNKKFLTKKAPSFDETFLKNI